MNDAAAELRLRKIDLPVERVQETFDALQAAIKEAGPVPTFESDMIVRDGHSPRSSSVARVRIHKHQTCASQR
jgi:hypothetical protein